MTDGWLKPTAPFAGHTGKRTICGKSKLQHNANYSRCEVMVKDLIKRNTPILVLGFGSFLLAAKYGYLTGTGVYFVGLAIILAIDFTEIER